MLQVVMLSFLISVLVMIFFNILPDFSANIFFTLSRLQTIYFVICNVISYKFKCTTVKIAFTTEDDIRMSKHVLQTKSCGFFIKNLFCLFRPCKQFFQYFLYLPFQKNNGPSLTTPYFEL